MVLVVDAGTDEMSHEAYHSCSAMVEVSGEQIVNLKTERQLLREECLKELSGGWLNEELLKWTTIFQYMNAGCLYIHFSTCDKWITLYLNEILTISYGTGLWLTKILVAYCFDVHQYFVSRNC